MAEVFLASSLGAEGFSRKVAIKRVLPGYSDNEAFAKMFVAEARISSQLVHPNIVSVLDFDRDAEHRLFLVMELVEGKDLDALVSTGLLPYPVVVFVIAEVLRGLGYAHDLPVGNEARGVVHRDISPHNVLLSWSGAVKVSDFGIAKARAASEATASVFIKGKPAYMSPEQANGQPLDGRSDLFAVGIMLWEMLVGRRLFTGEDTRATLAAVLFGQIPRPRSVRPDVPKDLERVAMKLLERDLPARYATAEQALHDLLECHDAPKMGREVLVRALAERFPQEAPVRQSMVRHGVQPATPVPLPDGTPVPPGTPTALESRPAAPVPSLGAVMNAPTATLDLRAPRNPRSKWILLAIAAVASALVTFALVAALKSSPSGSTAGVDAAPDQLARVAAEAGPAPDAPAPNAVPPDAPPPPPPPIDAMLVVAPPADAPADPKKDDPPPQPAEKRYGSLNVTSFPSQATIYIDGKKVGDTPRTIPKVLAGRRKIRLVNEEAGIDKTYSITISENRQAELNHTSK